MAMRVTRRAVGSLLAGTALVTTTACARRNEDLETIAFPKAFLWGAATAAFQIEGALDVDGRGPSIWDEFQRDPEHIADQSTAALATDSYRRWRDDIALLAGADLNAYRFSIAWPRVLPDGAGQVNEKGLDYYRALIDGLLARNITPYATLFHWDLPQALYAKGGWGARDTAYRLADYAALIADKLGDRLKHFIILNEAAVHTIIGHVVGLQAPGIRGGALLGPATHHQNLGQGLAITAIRARRSDPVVGTTMALLPVRPEPPWWHLQNYLPAEALDQVWNGAYLDPLFEGRYPLAIEPFLKGLVKDGDMTLIRRPIDFLGVNYYSPTYAKFDSSNPAYIGPGEPPQGVELDAFGREIDPSGLREMLSRLRNHYGNPHVLITENGCSDPLSTGPAIKNDRFRMSYIARHLREVHRAMQDGSPIGGYFVWTLVDNWEWEKGFTAKFGLVAMDRSTGLRTRKASYAWFGELARTGRLGAEFSP